MSRRGYHAVQMTHRAAVPAASRMIGATLVTAGYEALADEAVKRFRACTGLDTMVLRSESESGYFTKLQLPELLGDCTVIFYDADWWAVAPWAVAQYAGTPALVAVHDPAAGGAHHFPRLDADQWGLPRGEYFNTGLMIWDNANPLHRAVFRTARALYNAHLAGNVKALTDRTEQSWINVARHLLGCPLDLLPLAHNYFHYLAEAGLAHPPAVIAGLHAAGVPLADKLAHLRKKADGL